MLMMRTENKKKTSDEKSTTTITKMEDFLRIEFG